MAFDLAVTISMHFYERCQTNRDVWNFEKNGDSSTPVRLSPRCVWGGGGEGGGGGGGVLWYFHTYFGRGFFLGFKILNFNIFGCFRKLNIFWYEDFVDIFLGSSQNWTIKVQTGGYFLGCSNFKYLLGFFKCLIFFLGGGGGGGGGGVNGRCWARAYIWRKMRAPPPPWGLSVSSNLSLLNAYKWAFVLVGFCPSGLLS